MKPPVLLCIDCHFYEAGADESSDLCKHPKSQRGMVRAVQWYPCHAMRAGICESAKFWRPRESEAA